MAIVGHIVPILAERGVGTVVATAAVVAQAIASGTTQPTLGWLLDRFGLRVLPPLFLMNVLSLVLFCFTANTMLCVLAGAALGIGIGMQFCAIPFLVNLRFGLNSFGSVMGLMYAAIFLGEGIGPLILDLVYDNLGSYLPALLATLAVMLAATLCSTILSRISVRTGGDTMQPQAA
jgi:MFS family permease